MSRVKSTNEVASITLGLDSQWIHIPAGLTGRVTITPRTGEQVTLLRVVINTSGSGSPLVLTDSGTGMIASLAAAATPGQYPYHLPCKQGSPLFIDNAGGADVTITFKDR